MRGPAGTARVGRRALPPGTTAVAGGLVVLGLAAYVFLALAGHALSAADFSALSVLWVIVFAVGPGLFFPLEQELARVVAGRTEAGDGPGAVVARVAALAAAALAALLVLLVVVGPWVSARLFGGDRGLTAALGLNVVALALVHLSRGVLAGTGRFRRYGAQLAVDGVLRCGVAAVLPATGLASPAAFGVALAAAQVLAVLVTAGGAVRLESGPPAPWATVTAGLGLLLASTLAAQVLVNVGVVVARLLAADPALAGELLSAAVLTRLPLFAYAALQASLLPSLSRAVAAGDEPAYRRTLSRALWTVVGLGVAGAAVCAALGVRLTRVLFDARGVLSAADFAWLSTGTAVFLVALVLGQGGLALGRHAVQAVAWTTGLAVLVAVTLAPLGVLARVELGYLLGSLTVVLMLAADLTRRRSGVAAQGPGPSRGPGAVAPEGRACGPAGGRT